MAAKLVEWVGSPLTHNREITAHNWQEQQGFEAPPMRWERTYGVGAVDLGKPYYAPQVPEAHFGNPVVYVEEWTDELESYFGRDQDFRVHEVKDAKREAKEEAREAREEQVEGSARPVGRRSR